MRTYRYPKPKRGPNRVGRLTLAALLVACIVALLAGCAASNEATQETRQEGDGNEARTENRTASPDTLSPRIEASRKTQTTQDSESNLLAMQTVSHGLSGPLLTGLVAFVLFLSHRREMRRIIKNGKTLAP